MIECLKNDNLQETTLKGLTLIALHETSDLRAREEARLLKQAQGVGNLVPVLNRQQTSAGQVPNNQGLNLKRSLSVQQAAAKTVNLVGLSSHIPVMLEMLNKASVKIQCSALETLEALTRRYQKPFAHAVGQVAKGLAPLISDNELSTTYLALKVAYNLVKVNPAAPQEFKPVLDAVLDSVFKDQISGMALTALAELIAIAATNKMIDKIMVQKLLDIVSLNAQQAALILAIVAHKDQTHKQLIQQFQQQLNDKNSKYLVSGCLCLGEFGKIQDISGDKAIHERV